MNDESIPESVRKFYGSTPLVGPCGKKTVTIDELLEVADYMIEQGLWDEDWNELPQENKKLGGTTNDK